MPFSMLTLFRMGLFGAAHRWGSGQKGPLLPNICQTYPTMIILAIVIPYLKKIQKIYESHDTPLEFCWHQLFFTTNQQFLLYQEMQILIAFWYLICNYFDLSWVFKECFNKYGYTFDDVSKNRYFRPS